eukprot:1161722-Pelagomonas_calceolata.AAC.2
MALELAVPVLQHLTKRGCRGSVSALNSCCTGWLAAPAPSSQGHHAGCQLEQPWKQQLRAISNSAALPLSTGVFHCPPPREPAPDECCQVSCVTSPDLPV